MIVKEEIRRKIAEELDELVQALIPYHPEKIILFGSFARDDFHEASDIDIVVIKQTSKRFLDRIGDVLSLYPGRRGLEVLVYTPEEFQKMSAEGNSFIRQVLAEGKTIYESK